MALSVEDRLEILELAARYSHAFDYGDTDAFVETFTQDGVVTNGQETLSGAEQLRAFAAKHAQGSLNGRHWTCNHVIDGDGESATHSSYLMIVRMNETPIIGATGIYRDSLKKVDGEWRFVRREITKECPE
jgi:uncharacterized protein (TIGR02246 family)